MDKEREPQDVMSWLLKAMNEKDPSAPPSEQAVEEDARLLIIAGRYVTGLSNLYRNQEVDCLTSRCSIVTHRLVSWQMRESYEACSPELHSSFLHRLGSISWQATPTVTSSYRQKYRNASQEESLNGYMQKQKQWLLTKLQLK